MFKNPFPSVVQFAILREEETIKTVLHAAEQRILPPGATEARSRDFRLGRLAARRALGAIGIEGPVLRHTDRSPVWPHGVVGSITHAAGWAAAVVATRHDVASLGLDLESLTVRLYPAFAQLIADPEEQRWVGSRRDRLISLFSAKETVFKAIYPICRRYFGFDAVHLEPIRAGFTARLNEDLGCLLPVDTRLTVRCDLRPPFVMTSVLVNLISVPEGITSQRNRRQEGP